VGEGERDIECRCESPKGHRIPSCEGACVCVSVRGGFRGSVGAVADRRVVSSL